MFAPSAQEVRRFFCQAWAKQLGAGVLTPLELQAVDWMTQHPEFHELLQDEEAAVNKDFSVEQGHINPFLHLSMHLSITEQTSIDQPPGIRAAVAKLAARLSSLHEAQHAVMDALGETVWEAQRAGRPPDSQAYLERVLRLAQG